LYSLFYSHKYSCSQQAQAAQAQATLEALEEAVAHHKEQVKMQQHNAAVQTAASSQPLNTHHQQQFATPVVKLELTDKSLVQHVQIYVIVVVVVFQVDQPPYMQLLKIPTLFAQIQVHSHQLLVQLVQL